ncbi:unnamed protein product [Protopolystoma xenopodis]|uniref:Uncharacterized protein n=1 Tax=Protopolystoma xenopodis TaxID=117903 RepID=A0A3S5CN85_9PLAT|nr:unnamed protein product [Protopolystoma xenopodis]
MGGGQSDQFSLPPLLNHLGICTSTPYSALRRGLNRVCLNIPDGWRSGDVPSRNQIRDKTELTCTTCAGIR